MWLNIGSTMPKNSTSRKPGRKAKTPPAAPVAKFQADPPVGTIAPLSPSIRQSTLRDSHRIKLARYAAESVGAKVVGDPVQRGDNVLIPCDAQSTVEGTLQRRLKAIGGKGVKLHRFSDRRWIQFPDPAHAEMLTFKLHGKKTVAVKPFTNTALLNTRNDFLRTLEEIRTVVRSNKAIKPDDLSKQFATTRLARAAEPRHWDEWIKNFASGELTPKNAVLVLLGDTTGIKLGSLEVKMSRGKRRGKVLPTSALR